MEQVQGMTMTELMIALAILGVLLAVAVPDLGSFVVRHRGESALSSLAVALQSARTTAIRSGRTVTFCRSADTQSCGGQWHQGYIAFTDRNRDRRINQDDSLLLTGQFPDLQGSLRWRAFGNRQYLQIDGRGHILHQNGSFTFCPDSGSPEHARQLVVSQVGRLRMAVDADGDGIVENSAGAALSCN